METAVALAPIQSSRTYTDDGDKELVRASKDGNIAAFDELVRRYDRKLLRIAHNIIHNLEDAEEVVQEAFLKAFQKLGQFQGTAKFSTWLVRITLNESFMKLRKQRGFMESLDTNSYDNGESDGVPIDLTDWAPNPEALYSRTELGEILTTSLERLTPALKVVFVLRDVEEYSINETADILNLTDTTVKTRLSRARLKLREYLSQYFKKRG